MRKNTTIQEIDVFANNLWTNWGGKLLNNSENLTTILYIAYLIQFDEDQAEVWLSKVYSIHFYQPRRPSSDPYQGM